MKRIFLICFAALSAVSDSRAFLYDEHCILSNLALRLAIHRAEHGASPAMRALTTPELARLRRLADGSCSPGKSASFGDITALADYGLSPFDLYLHAPNPEARLQYTSGEIPSQMLRSLGANVLARYRSSHLNEDHFQDRALFVHAFWHETAIRLAREQNLFSALLFNAFAQHFLQDMFAPGHVRTPRRNLHDQAALGLHDRYNRRGETFYPDNVDELVAMTEAGTPPELTALLDAVALPVAEYLDRLRQVGLPMQGDGYLFENPGQYLFIVLVSSRSIFDVIESYLNQQEINSFTSYAWRGYSLDGRSRSTPRMVMAFGEFPGMTETGGLDFMGIGMFLAGHQSLFRGRSGASRVLMSVEVLVAGSPGGTWLSRGDTDETVRIPQFSVPLGYSFTMGSGVHAHGPMARLVVPVEMIDTQFSLVAGYRWYTGLEHKGRAFHGGLRVEMGYGLAFLGLGLEVDHHIGPDGRLRPYLSLNSTALISNSFQRLPFLK